MLVGALVVGVIGAMLVVGADLTDPESIPLDTDFASVLRSFGAEVTSGGVALEEVDPKTLESASRDMYDSMTEGELEELASTSLDGLPEHKLH